MVAIKSLAVLLFAAAAAAGPGAGGHGHGSNVDVKDSSIKCGNQDQKIYCCNDNTHEKAVGQYTGVFNGLSVKCNSVPVNVLAVVDVVSAQKQCSAGAACCNAESDENGVVNIVTGCVAPVVN
ncbi:unnamed protein product [Tuber aestivum]|uniref:Hydrophobin n=1 Tax=Tuber aestivum TaxID=59557 RepID=A0A292PZ70_9PEZI|nr:unnamed protein product [Tuber aestivum]